MHPSRTRERAPCSTRHVLAAWVMKEELRALVGCAGCAMSTRSRVTRWRTLPPARKTNPA